MQEFPWDAPVGRFMLAFGSIEHTTISLLGCLPDCCIPGNAPFLALGQRIAILQEVLPRYPGEEYRDTLASLNTISKFTSKRNLVAHNSVWFDIYKDGDRIMLTNHLISARDRTKRLTLEQMRALADQVYKAASEFSDAALDVMKNYIDEDDEDR